MTNLAIVSDIRLYREGLARILGESANINVVAALDNHIETLDLLQKDRVDVLLFDMRMKNSDELLTVITKDYAGTKIIVLAVPENDDNYLLCLESGIAGYLSKESSIDELVEAVRTVESGRMYCPCDITQHILKYVKNRGNDNKANDIQLNYTKPFKGLTQRESQIVKLVAEGMSNKKIAKVLTIELSTVKNHVHNILVKMGVESRTQVACLLQENISPKELER